MNATTADAGSAPVTDQPGACQLRRSGDGRMLAGVADGIARYLNADVTLVRVIIAALALFTGADVALYIAAWLLIPGGRRRPAGRRSVGRRPPGPLPLDPDPQTA
jgi:phage shock protein PspC (stress-responsive transcriptional regulator)